MKQKTVTVEDIVDLLKKKKQAYKALADEYKDRYNNKKDSNKAICRNMYYQNIYMYNEAEDTLAEIEGRQPKMYCFTFPQAKKYMLSLGVNCISSRRNKWQIKSMAC